MICFQISIFEPLNTASEFTRFAITELWFAFKLVSLNHWIQRQLENQEHPCVVICFQISIFEPLNTASFIVLSSYSLLWFAFKLVSLNHWIQPYFLDISAAWVVICFQISIFEPLNTARHRRSAWLYTLWFAFKLVSLNHWIQLEVVEDLPRLCCDLLSN